MADFGRREVVNDPLAMNPREREQQAALPTYGIRNPGMRAGNAATRKNMSVLNVLDGIQASISKIQEASNEEAQINGQLTAVREGVDAARAKAGDKYTRQGVESIASVNNATEWFNKELEFQQSEEGMSMDPAQYQQRLMETRKAAMEGISDDPVVKKMWAAAFKDYGPRLIANQTEGYNKYNELRGGAEFMNMLMGVPPASADSSVRVNDDGFRVNQEQVRNPVTYNSNDEDIVIRTMLGEAGGEGAEGMAAVAHVIINRMEDGRWPKTLQDVALQDKQFSAWNSGAGGNDPLKYSDTSPAYLRAKEIFQAVANGHHVDPTGGATHYYSPSGMNALVAEGSQSNNIPSWLDEQRAASGGEIRIGNHVFVGKKKNGGVYVDPVVSAQGKAVQFEQTGDGAPELVAQAEGIPVGQQPTRPNASQVQRMIMNSPLKNETKASALAKAMTRTLDDGDDTLFNDAGGVSMLAALGASASDIDAVHKAKQRFEENKEKEYDTNYERARADLVQRAKDGGFKDLNEAQAEIDKLTTGKSASEAKQVARAVYAEYNKAGSDIVPLELRNLAAQLKDGTDSGLYTPEEASQKIIDYKKANPQVKDSVINNFVADVYSRAQSQKDKLQNDLRTAMEKRAKEEQVSRRVQIALQQGSGLKGADGRMSIPDEANPGRVKEVPAEEAGIWMLKQNVTKGVQNAIATGQITADAAEVKYYNEVYENLAKQGVYDTNFGRQVAASVTGDILGPDKQPTEQSMQALSFYMQMRDNPKVGADYLAGMIDNQQARVFLETAATLYDGQNDISTSLLRANTILQTRPEGVEKLEKNAAYYAVEDKEVNRAVRQIAQKEGFWNRILPGEFTEQDITSIQQNDAVMNAYIRKQAETYHLQNPNVLPEVAAKMAADDLARNSVIIGKDVIIGNESKGTRLDQAMGLETFGRNGPHMAVKDYIKEFGSDLWGDFFTDQIKALKATGPEVGNLSSLTGIKVHALKGGMDNINYGVTYNPAQGILEVVLYKDEKRSETFGEPLYLDAKTLGDRYKKKAQIGQSNAIKDAARNFIDTITDNRQRMDAYEAGGAIGRMLQPNIKQGE